LPLLFNVKKELFSSSTNMVLNLKTLKSRLYLPTLFCVKNTGNLESIIINKETITSIGLKSKIPKNEIRRSKNLIIICVAHACFAL